MVPINIRTSSLSHAWPRAAVGAVRLAVRGRVQHTHGGGGRAGAARREAGVKRGGQGAGGAGDARAGGAD